MANWNKTLDISEEFAQAKSGDITNVELSRIIVEKLSNISYDIFGQEELNEILNERLREIIEDFQDIVDNNREDVENIDAGLEELYDFGDRVVGYSKYFSQTHKAMFVKTF